MLSLPEEDVANAFGDWVEASLLADSTDVTRVTDTLILDELNEAARSDAEGILDTIIRTIRARSIAIGKAYPIGRTGSGFSRKGAWNKYPLYSFMLFVSLNQWYSTLRFSRGTANKPAELFESLTGAALSGYLGCSVLRIGAPRRPPVPGAFPSAIDFLTRELGEAIGARDIEDHTSGDDGLDIVAWLSPGDQRSGQVMLFAQCAIGTDWKKKRNDLNNDVWRRHIDWHTAPLRGFAVPFQIQQGSSWRETATAAGIVFDRLRIARWAKNVSSDITDDIEKWCEKRVKAVRKLSVAAA